RMRMQLEACEIREPDERGRITRHDLLRRASGREAQLDDVDPLGTLLRRTLLIEEFAVDAVRIPHEHVRSSARGAERAVRDRKIVANMIVLRVPAGREQHLLRIQHRYFPAGNFDRLDFARLRHSGDLSQAIRATSRVPARVSIPIERLKAAVIAPAERSVQQRISHAKPALHHSAKLAEFLLPHAALLTNNDSCRTRNSVLRCSRLQGQIRRKAKTQSRSEEHTSELQSREKLVCR